MAGETKHHTCSNCGCVHWPIYQGTKPTDSPFKQRKAVGGGE